jgi:hypothetical protein
MSKYLNNRSVNGIEDWGLWRGPVINLRGYYNLWIVKDGLGCSIR